MKTVIGLEIHVQLKTKSKMFCGCDNEASGKEPNTVICPVCLGMPGTLPVANKQAIDWAIKTGLALHAKISKKSKFDRKHYFYPDLPKGYQISQYDQPFCMGGYLEIPASPAGREIDGQKKKINLRRIHLEEDAGKLIHPVGANYSLVDLNRAGTPLMEIVTEPDINSPLEAKLFLQKLRTILRHLDVSNADMEKGHLRCDANISIEVDGKEGTPSEIKNMNSFKMVEKALMYEEQRQRGIIEEGGKIEKETRGWIDTKGITVSQRSKEYAHDYRYFPDPDLPPFYFEDNEIKNIQESIGEDFENAAVRYREIGIPDNEINIIVSTPDKKNYFENMASKLVSNEEKVVAAKWIVNRFYDRDYAPQEYAEFVKKLVKGEIPQGRAIEVIKTSAEKKQKIANVIIDLGLTKMDDEGKISSIVDGVISENEKPVHDYKAGKEAVLQYLVGQVMAKTKGQANPIQVEKLLKDKLS